ncbi:hypothetical protein SEA_SBLACKBERRY_2 [Microbacterium phage SBlackberry]|nr:hypothetical protein SEA_ZANELLA_2 [Microbacterium phage Zanella]UAW08747.1 hypothetical protein SEA_SBLACKBERRY_2 [Microbacterium phage SBlackberry]
MTEQSPIEKLQEAVDEFFRVTNPDDELGMLTGVAVIVEYKSFTDDPDAMPVADRNLYALGANTSTATAAGLAQYLRVVSERAMWRDED